jgi:tight adherence protein B
MSVITIFVILLTVAFAIVAFFTEPSQAEKQTRERLAAVSLRPIEELDADITREVTYSRIPLVDRLLRRSGVARNLRRALEQAKVSWTVGRFVLYSLILMSVGATIGNILIPLGFFGWLVGLLLGILPLIWVLYRRSARMQRLSQQLPQAVDLISRGLQAGYALPNSMVMVADELPDPVGPEFRRTADEMNFGLPFREAVLNLADRYPVEDLQFLITAILVQKETGGNLVELLDKLAVLLRARIQLRQKIRVFTAQGRITGAILVAMPFALFFLLNLINPGYSKPMLQSETGREVIYGTLASMAVGILMIRRIVSIRV